MNTITIDCGSSFTKAALFDDNGAIVKSIQRQSPRVVQTDFKGTAQIDNLIPLVKDIFAALTDQINGNEVRLCISNEMHGFLLATTDGTPITDYISWQKEYGNLPTPRGTAIDILSDCQQEIVHTGMPLRSGLASVNLLYIKAIDFIRSDKTPLRFYTLGDYVLRMISGIEPPCHVTNAAATGLFDLTTGDWNHKLLKIVAPNSVEFPTVGIDPIEFKWNDHVNVIALPTIGDQQAALYGAGLNRADELSFNMGTGGQVSRIITTLEFGEGYQTRPFLDGRYIKTIPHLPCGRALNVYLRFIHDLLERFDADQSDADIWQRILTATDDADGGDLVCDLSFFDNAVTDRRTGLIDNISEYSLTIGNLMKAVFNRVAEDFCRAADSLIGDDHIEKILFSGGVARRIKSIRNRILTHYESAAYSVADNETLYGLFRYGEMI